MNVGFKIPAKVDTEPPERAIRSAPLFEFRVAQLAAHCLSYSLLAPRRCGQSDARDPALYRVDPGAARAGSEASGSG